jgi:hypothetical protein
VLYCFGFLRFSLFPESLRLLRVLKEEEEG